MEIGIQQRAINGLIDLWEDICFVQGKGFRARQLKPHIQIALEEPGSAIHRLIGAMPDREEWYTRYANYSSPGFRGKIGKIAGISIGQRRKMIGQNLTRKEVQELLQQWKPSSKPVLLTAMLRPMQRSHTICAFYASEQELWYFDNASLRQGNYHAYVEITYTLKGNSHLICWDVVDPSTLNTIEFHQMT